MSRTASNVSLLNIFLKDSSNRERPREYKADAPSVHRNPMMYFPWETLVEASESGWIARSEAERVRRKTELKISGLIFWEFMRKEKTAMKAN